ncbi:U3 snoRNP protein [Cavenderia fasciculata]|uniref:U3 snoRNP protein n=1 Tax=Cavenderia fasciculata TaxID=261658 RepID=F4PLD4_CACFS|nr:U3 snoRNP protein [Cavenderia fasciculata]EGG23356.1 U3 snoRNP protein [Cavenderia fasciculata]|eukprot:XP_004361207.1 U3 snoRNP protein [Cavenderia fasciculata]
MVEKRKSSNQTNNVSSTSFKKKKEEIEDTILSMGDDDDYLDDGEDNGSEDESGSENFEDYVDDGDEELDDSEAVVGTPLSQKMADIEDEDEERENVNLRVKKGVDSLEKTAAPTTEEMQEYNETAQLFNSNLFRLQVIEFFKEIKINYTKTTSLESALFQLKSIFDSIQPHQVKSNQCSNQVKIFGDQTITVTKPSSVDLVGSYMLKSTIKSNPNVDVSVEIPSSIVGEEDIYEYKYFTKRNIYLWALAKEVAKNERFSDIEFQNWNGDSNKQMFIIRPKADPKTGAITRFQIRVFISLDKNFVPLSKLSPISFNLSKTSVEDQKKKKNLQQSTTQDTLFTLNDQDLLQDQIDPLDLKFGNPNNSKNLLKFNQIKRSSYYNNSILEDMMYFEHMELLHDRIKNAPVLIDAIQLIKSWLIVKKVSTINSFQLSMLVAYLYDQGKVNKNMSSYQIFRMVLVSIVEKFVSVNRDAKPCGPMFFKASGSQAPVFGLHYSSFRRLYPMALIDASGYLNITSRVTSWALEELAQEARKSLVLLDSGDGFDEIFLQQGSPSLRYDYLLSIPLKGCQLEMPSKDYYSQELYCSHYIYRLLCATLTNRIRSITVVQDQLEGWAVDQPRPDAFANRTIHCGIELDINQWQRLIDKGPSGDHVDSDAFQAKWGKLSQLRRFKDGTIVHAVVWNPPGGRRHMIIEMIAKYILSTRLSIQSDSVSANISMFDRILQAPTMTFDAQALIVAKETIITAVDQLDLPLKINGYYPIGPALRYTSVEVVNDPQYINNQPIEILLQFENNPNWSSDIKTIELLKTAFMLKIARELEQYQPRLSTQQYVDVQYQGFLFRLIPYYPRELDFLGSEHQDVRQAILLHQNGLQHHSFIQTLANQQPAFSTATRLAQRWCYSNLFSDDISIETIELLMASIFKSTSTPPPTTPILGFIKFLRLISTYEWSERPLIVDYQQDISLSDTQSIQEIFDNQKKANNLPLFFIATHKDRASIWFKSLNSRDTHVRDRLIKCAKQSFASLNQLNLTDQLDMNAIFNTPQLDFDLKIMLNANFITNFNGSINNLLIEKKENEKENEKTKEQENSQTTVNGNEKTAVVKTLLSKYSNFNSKSKSTNAATTKKEIIVGHNLIKLFVDRLRSDPSLSCHCQFYYDKIGGDAIHVVFNPKSWTPLAFRPLRSVMALPIDATNSSNLVIPNLYEIIAHITDLGGKLINQVKLNPSSTILKSFDFK